MLCLQKLKSDQLHPVLIHGHCLVFLPSAISELAKKGWHHCPALCRIILLLIFTVEHEVKALLSLQPPGILVLSSISLETTWHQLNKSISSRPQSLHSLSYSLCPVCGVQTHFTLFSFHFSSDVYSRKKG